MHLFVVLYRKVGSTESQDFLHLSYSTFFLNLCIITSQVATHIKISNFSTQGKSRLVQIYITKQKTPTLPVFEPMSPAYWVCYPLGRGNDSASTENQETHSLFGLIEWSRPEIECSGVRFWRAGHWPPLGSGAFPGDGRRCGSSDSPGLSWGAWTRLSGRSEEGLETIIMIDSPTLFFNC